VSYSEVNSPYGHDAFLLEPEVLGRLIGGFLARAAGSPVLSTSGNVEPYREQPAVESAWTRRRGDYDRIEELVEPGSSVLDLGCGRGALLSRLISRKGAVGSGVEVYQDAICECIERGIAVIDVDIESQLGCFPDDSYDYVVLSQTLQTVREPDGVLKEMLRIGRKCIVSFPNFVQWKGVIQMLLTGRTPVTENLPFRWYNTPNLHFLTIRDFEDYCRQNGIRVLRRLALMERCPHPLRFLPSVRAEEAIFVISKGVS
jgi:methionine biosynthesis protein MetW